MSDTIKNPKGGLVLKVANFDNLKFYLNSFPYVIFLEIKISDFDFNEFLSERLIKDSKFDFNDHLNKTGIIERFLLYYYYIYEKNPKDYNKFIEIEQKISNRIFYKDGIYSGSNMGLLYKSTNFDELKKIWYRNIKFPIISDLNLNNFFVHMEKTPKFDLEDYLRKRDIIVSFLNLIIQTLLKKYPLKK